MAKPKFRDYLAKRDLLNEPDADRDRLLEWASSCMEAGYIHDALEFYKKAGDTAAIERILTGALDEGDVFLVKQALGGLKRDLSTEEWLKLGKRAEALGKFAFAAEAYRKAGAEEEVARLLLLTGEVVGEADDLDRPKHHA
ncbi:hypothetical protein [Thermodesulforhabdus norvegica]|uniref:Tetratricopeptide repeat-containing protein n=1 Tax=Thermodesulforhabdus norvegica TaxID=39841 RepID=A0A1I4UVL3_9BACT|nr:hypothetical protein [Thermodesulforhabdus norvegica]SFM93057.1 hypothetical protein SAMN05660836_01996 [Thermodesulforhabdus norvegica]